MKRLIQINQLRPTISVGLNFQADNVCVFNPTGSPVLVRVGSPEIPTNASADYTVPANSVMTMGVQGREFGVGFSMASVLSVVGAGNLTLTASITFYSAGEPLPNFGSANFASLSLSELTAGTLAVSGASTSAAFDLQPWGGCLLSLFPGVGSGQGFATAQVSSDLITWRTFGEYAFWPASPVSLLLPRGPRYMRFVFSITSIVGEPAIAYAYNVRATVTEVLQTSFSSLSGTSMVRAYNSPGVGEQDFIFATAGVPSLSISLKNTTAGAGRNIELLLETSQDGLANWRTLWFREQNVDQGFFDSIYRSSGSIDRYIRVRVVNLTVNAQVGFIFIGAQENADLTSILQSIYSSIGDPQQPANVGQSLWHLLTSILALENAWLPGLGWLPLIETDTTNIDVKLGTVVTNQGAQQTSLSNIDTKLGTVNANLGTVITNQASELTSLSSILAALNTLVNAPNFNVQNLSFSTTMAAAGVYQNFGAFLTPGNYLTGLDCSYVVGAPVGANFSLSVATGPAGGPISTIYTKTGLQPEAAVPFLPLNYGAGKGGGFAIPPGHTTIWVVCSIAGTLVDLTLYTRAP